MGSSRFRRLRFPGVLAIAVGLSCSLGVVFFHLATVAADVPTATPTGVATPSPGPSQAPAATGTPVVTLTPIPSPTATIVRRMRYGMALGSVRVGQQPDGALPLIREAGFDTALAYVSWRTVQPRNRLTYDWRALDDVVGQVRGQGLRLIVRIMAPPDWAINRGTTTDPYVLPEDLAEFVAAVAAHAGDAIDAYVILNEPNLALEWVAWDRPQPGMESGLPPDAARYMRLLRATHNRVKQVNPNALVISAPLAPTGEQSRRAIDDRIFLQQMYDLGLATVSDVVGMNGLGFAYSPDDGSDANGFNFSRLARLRTIMVANGDQNKPAWALEVGWLVDSPEDLGEFNWMKVSEANQAAYLRRAYEKAQAEWPWLQAMFVWNMNVYEGGREFRWFSLLARDATWPWTTSPRPAYYALQEMPKPAVATTPPPSATPTPTATASPTSPPSKAQASVPVDVGWTNLALPANDLGPYTAESLLEELNRQGLQAGHAARWKDGRWESHLWRFPANDFDVETGRGYFVRATNYGVWYPPTRATP